jgi:death on curing protein
VIEDLTLDDALAAVDELGFVIVDPGLFASAIGRPATTIFSEDAYPDLPTKAAALFESLARNPALVDGNKRTAWVLMRLQLAINGFGLIADDDEAEEFVLAVAQGQLALAGSAKWIAEHGQPLGQ